MCLWFLPAKQPFPFCHPVINCIHLAVLGADKPLVNKREAHVLIWCFADTTNSGENMRIQQQRDFCLIMMQRVNISEPKPAALLDGLLFDSNVFIHYYFT